MSSILDTPSTEEIIKQAVDLVGEDLFTEVLKIAKDVSTRVNGVIQDDEINEIKLDLDAVNEANLKEILEQQTEETLKKIQQVVMSRLDPIQRAKMAETVLGRELNKDQKKAVYKGHQLEMPELLTEAGFSEEEISLLAQKNVIERRKQLHEVRDGLTGFRGKGVILSEAGMDDIERKIPGKKIFVFLDFNNMGPPNDFNLGGEIDEFIKFFGDLSREMFTDIPNEFLRLGGDEFGIFLPDTTEAIARYEAFFDRLEEQRKEIFNSDNLGKNFDDTIEHVEIRMGVRKLRKGYEAECKKRGEDFTIGKFVNDLKRKGANLPKEMEDFSVERLVGLLQLDLVNKQEKDPVSILTNARAAVKIGKEVNPTIVSGAKQQSEDLFHQYKPIGEPVPEDILELSKKFTRPLPENEADMTDEEYEINTYENQAKDYEKLKKEYLDNPEQRKFYEKELYNFKFKDPVASQIFKLNLAKNETAKDLLRISKPKKFNILTLDIPLFGAINNNEGYARGDAVIRKISKIAKNTLGVNEIFRLGGGCLKFLVGECVSDDLINKFNDEIVQYWEAQNFIEETRSEASEKQALNEVKAFGSFDDITVGNNLTEKPEFGSFKIDSEKREISPDDQMYEIL